MMHHAEPFGSIKNTIPRRRYCNALLQTCLPNTAAYQRHLNYLRPTVCRSNGALSASNADSLRGLVVALEDIDPVHLAKIIKPIPRLGSLN